MISRLAGVSRDERSILEYGQPLELRRRKRNQRALIAGAFALTALLSVPWIADFFGRLPGLLAQRRCLTHLAPPDLIAYTDDPTETAALLQSDSRYGTHPLVHVSSPPPDWKGAIAYYPEALEQLLQGRNRSRALFLHERSSPTGESRLVLVDSDLTVHPDSRELHISGQATKVSTLTPLRYRDIYSWQPGLLIRLGPNDRLRIFAGRPAPEDESRFTIPTPSTKDRE